MASRNLHVVVRGALSASVAAIAIGLLGGSAAYAQEKAEETSADEIVVTGVRASLDRAIDIKRNATGVVDAISAEDIGKFPDTNLAESLQRVPGISISRVNGEGSQVTARGFGPGYNLVTLNGRQMPTASILTIGGDQNSDYASGVGRAFDFGNLASEGVSRLEVYKTGRAANPSGGIGASVNVVTRRPLDAKDAGFTGSIGGKAVYDVSGGTSRGITPEFSGLASWSNDDQNIGISIFGSYQKRRGSAVSATSNNWNVITRDQFIARDANGNGPFTTNATQITNLPSSNQLVAFPNDSRYHYSEYSRERINAQAVLQLKPTDSLTITADALFAQTSGVEQRADQANWFNRPFRTVRFDTNPVVATAVFLEDTVGGTKDAGFEQQYRSSKGLLESYGLNVEQELSDKLTLRLDGHISKATSKPNSPSGASSTIVGIGTPTTAGHTVDYSGKIPVQAIRFVDTAPRGNGNGRPDVGDLGSQVLRTFTASQVQSVKEMRADLAWDFGGGVKFDFGGEYIDSKNRSKDSYAQQTLGNWGIDRPGDVEALAPGIMEAYCLACEFSKNPGLTGASLVAFRGNAVDLFNKLSPVYAAQGNALQKFSDNDNRVREKTWAVFGQASWKGDLGSMPATAVAGVRYEKTDVTSTSLIAVPQSINWVADNDFSTVLSATVLPVTDAGKYSLFLPSLDLSIEPFDNVIARASISRTAARTGFSDLFANTSVNVPSGPTANGGVASGSQGNPGLRPLLSRNIDVSLEWYFAKSSYIAIGFFDKKVKNFVGSGQFTKNLFGLRDPSSGAPGTRSGVAKDALVGIGQGTDDVNLFTMTALIQQTGSVAAATALYQQGFAGLAPRANPQAGQPATLSRQEFIDQVLSANDIVPNASDPLLNFGVIQPINNRSEHIYGFEISGQYFLGETGLGVAASYTKVNSSAKVDNGSSPNANQFALLGLSDTYNATLIYDKYGISGRLAYTWRGKTIAEINRGPGRSPSYVEPFGTLDLNISYDISDNLAVSFEGINLLGEDVRTYGRSVRQLNFYQQLEPRFLLGARYKF
jgi:TonB-dependent receptor